MNGTPGLLGSIIEALRDALSAQQRNTATEPRNAAPELLSGDPEPQPCDGDVVDAAGVHHLGACVLEVGHLP